VLRVLLRVLLRLPLLLQAAGDCDGDLRFDHRAVGGLEVGAAEQLLVLFQRHPHAPALEGHVRRRDLGDRLAARHASRGEEAGARRREIATLVCIVAVAHRIGRKLQFVSCTCDARRLMH